MRLFLLSLLVLIGCHKDEFTWPTPSAYSPLEPDTNRLWGVGEMRDYNYGPKSFIYTSNDCWNLVTRMNETNDNPYIKLYFMQQEP